MERGGVRTDDRHACYVYFWVMFVCFVLTVMHAVSMDCICMACTCACVCVCVCVLFLARACAVCGCLCAQRMEKERLEKDQQKLRELREQEEALQVKLLTVNMCARVCHPTLESNSKNFSIPC